MSAVETAICAEVRNARLHVLFDVEGLLLDPEPGIDASLLAVRARFAPECRDAPLPALAASLRETLARVLRSHEPQLLEAAIQHYHQHYDVQGRFQARLRPGITALLKRMRNDRRLAWHYLSTHDAARAQRLLERFGLEDAVDSVLCMAQPCCMGFRPRLLDTFLREGGLSLGHDLRARTLLLSDWASELDRAHALGLAALALQFGRSDTTDLAASAVAATAGSPAEVMFWIEHRLRALEASVGVAGAASEVPFLQMPAMAYLH